MLAIISLVLVSCLERVYTPKTKQQGGKRNIAIRDTIPALRVFYKGSLNEKNGILYKTNYNFNKFLKNHQSFPDKKGKSLKDMLVRAKKKKKG